MSVMIQFYNDMHLFLYASNQEKEKFDKTVFQLIPWN